MEGHIDIWLDVIVHLVGGFNPSEKYESQLGLLFPIYGKIQYKIFQTTNQSWFLNFLDHIKGPARWSVKRTSKDDQTGLV